MNPQRRKFAAKKVTEPVLTEILRDIRRKRDLIDERLIQLRGDIREHEARLAQGEPR